MRKIKNKKGFTLVEMLVCVVTLLLIGMIVSAGTNLAMFSLRESTFESNSQMLESTLNMYIGDILRYATEVETESDGTVEKFTNDAYYIDDGYFRIVDSKGNISETGYLVSTSSFDSEDFAGTMVANKGVYAEVLYITAFELKYDTKKHVFTGSYVIVSDMTDTTKVCNFSYRTVAD